MVTGESVARHQMVVYRMTLVGRKRKRAKAEQKIKWWKLKREECCKDLRQRLRLTLGGCEKNAR